MFGQMFVPERKEQDNEVLKNFEDFQNIYIGHWWLFKKKKKTYEGCDFFRITFKILNFKFQFQIQISNFVF